MKYNKTTVVKLNYKSALKYRYRKPDNFKWFCSKVNTCLRRHDIGTWENKDIK